MGVQKININSFLEQSRTMPVLDVRSPGEYKHAHLPGAYSFPLFSDEERKVVGTTYKQESRERAIKIGLDYFGPKMKLLVENAESICSQFNYPEGSTKKQILVHCWRGGMRSAAIAWLLDLYGFEVKTLEGGYKSFRNRVLQQFEMDYRVKVLGGNTGSGKTYLLHDLQQKGELVIDLEGLAKHKGSAFGNIGMPEQPTQEHFENLLALELIRCKEEPDRSIWVEDESQRIGTVNIPINLWKTFRKKPVYFLDIPFEERLQYIVKEYGSLDQTRLINAINRIKKRLGGLETKEAVTALEENRIADSFRILLSYYDKWYLKGLNNRESLTTLLNKIECETVTPENSKRLLE
jgi:tRNA 2-selenouridine synthase